MALDIDRKSGWQDWANLVLAILLFVAPWALGFADQANAAWNAWACGVVVAVLAVAALTRFAQWEEWIGAVVGVWLVISPWALGFAALIAALWSTLVLGALIAVSAAWRAWAAYDQGRHATA